MARMSLPLGFCFHPTDIELIMYYLKRKALGKKLCFEAIAEVNVYKYSPWDLPDKSCLKDLEWFFFCPVSRKYASGARSNRATESGYWKSTGKDRTVTYNGRIVGMVKTLVFHQGRAPKGNRTDWVLHEYRILEKQLADVGVGQAAYVLLKLFKKSGPGPKNGAQYGAPFNEEEWDTDDADEDEVCAETQQQSKIFPFPVVANTTGSVLPSENMPLSDAAHDNSNSVINGKLFQGVPPTGPLPGPGPSTTMSLANDVAPTVGEEGDLESLLVMLTEDPPIPSDANDVNQVNGEFMELDDIYGGLENLTDWEELRHWDQSCLSDNVYCCGGFLLSTHVHGL